MNESRAPNALNVEVELADSHSASEDLSPACEINALEPAPCEPTSFFETRIADRRVAQRYRSNEGRCWIGWQEVGGFRQSAAWILDISVSGSLIATDSPTPNDRSVWLRLDDPSVPDWAEARVIDTQISSAGICSARLVFRGACPYTFIKAVAFSSRPPAKPDRPSSWNLNTW